MEIRQLRSFWILIREGTLVRVADDVHLTPAAVYKQLKSLEDELGCQLYRRVGRRILLTPAGEALLPYSKSLLAQHDAAIAAARERAGKGVVRIGAGPAVGKYLLPGILRRYRRTLPNVEVTVETQHTSELIRRLTRGSLDLILAHSFLREERGVHIEQSWPVEFIFVSGAAKARHVQSVTGLRRFQFILFRKGSETQAFIDRYFEMIGLQPKVSVRFDNSEMVKEMALKGSGLAVLPFWAVEAELRHRSLRLLEVGGPRLFVPLALLSRKSGRARGPVDAFIRLARSFEWKHPRLARKQRRNE